MNAVRRPDLPWLYDLYLLGQKAARGDETAAAREQLLHHIVTAFGAGSGSLAEVNEDRASLTLIAGIDLPGHVIGSTIGYGEGILGWVAQHAQPLLLNGDLASDPRFRSRPDRRETAVPNSALCWPLVVEGETVGVISVNRGPEVAPYTEEDLRSGCDIVRFIAIAVENARLHGRSTRYVRKLKDLVQRLEEAQSQLLQSEKMASIGQLAAGVAHEINNPVGYISSNLNTLQDYLDDLFTLLAAYEAVAADLPADSAGRRRIAGVQARVDVAFLKKDLPALLEESQEGVARVRQIVRDLKEFSHVDEAEWQWADLHQGIESTLNIVYNELKYKAEVVREYGALPPVECIASQLNQVFMNLLVNAAQAIEERGVITVRTGVRDDRWVWVEISDTGKGIAREHLERLFEPFFTTKPVGKGTGLGLSLSYGIVERHGGRIEVASEPGQGATFRVWLPVSQAGRRQAASAG